MADDFTIISEESFEEHYREVLATWKLERWVSGHAPSVEIELEAWCDIMNAVWATPGELSWFHKVEVFPERRIRISGIHVPKQSCSLNHTMIAPETLLVTIPYELMGLGENHWEYRAWGHSHVDAKAYVSHVDWRAIQGRLATIVNGNAGPIAGPFIALVVNRFSDVSCWVNFARPEIGWQGVPVSLDREISGAALREFVQTRRDRIAEVVNERVQFTPPADDPEGGNADD